MSKATIDDVAALAGVSIKTVSRVVNREPNVRQATRERVESAIAALDYRPNLSARSLAGNRSFLLGLLYGIPSEYVLDVQEGVSSICRAQGYELLVYPCDHEDVNLVDAVLALISDKRIDGLMLTPPMSDNVPLLKTLRNHAIPVVSLSPLANNGVSSFVETNDRAATHTMINRLIDLGHNRIGFIGGHPDHGAMTTRYDGYRDALVDSGIPLMPHLIEQGFNSFESGVTCARKLLYLPHRPTAIFAANDAMAAGVMMVAHELGIHIPGDLSVVGFDDTSIARQVWPSLTTVCQPVQKMAAVATELLLEQVMGKTTEVRSCCIDSTLVFRASTGPASESTALRTLYQKSLEEDFAI